MRHWPLSVIKRLYQLHELLRGVFRVCHDIYAVHRMCRWDVLGGHWLNGISGVRALHPRHVLCFGSCAGIGNLRVLHSWVVPECRWVHQLPELRCWDLFGGRGKRMRGLLGW
jgi:hypothetical protein